MKTKKEYIQEIISNLKKEKDLDAPYIACSAKSYTVREVIYALENENELGLQLNENFDRLNEYIANSKGKGLWETETIV